MRVSIQVEDGDEGVLSPDQASASPPGAPASLQPSGAEPPAELAARAAATGALSAGPAPTTGATGGAPPLTNLSPGDPGSPGIGPTAAGASPDRSAGAAAMVDRPQPAVDEDEPDQESETQP